ncbi:hypothetical protein LXA43DRAFT_1098046 [Ganoderma leucocontextum]|nr:hypothetical protein LXA43DRAFT_1098046 [Ganoderma leucocontextum]
MSWDGVKFKLVDDEHIRMHHKVFHPKSDGNPGTKDLTDEFQTATWPVCDEAKPE